MMRFILVFLLLNAGILTSVFEPVDGLPQLICSSEVVALVGDDVILPCQIDPVIRADSIPVEWTKPDLDPNIVHLQNNGRPVLENQNPSYVLRTSLFVNELKTGNVSLQISKVKLSDEGMYRCFLPSLDLEAFIYISAEFEVKCLNNSITAKVGDDVILPCYVKPEMDVTNGEVEWSHDEQQVHVYREWKDDPKYQQETFRDRTSLFPEEMHRGNISLKLLNVTEADLGKYTCSISILPKGSHKITMTGEIILNVGTSLSVEDKTDFVLAVLIAVAAAVAAAAPIAGSLVFRHRTSLSGGDKAAIFLAVLVAAVAAAIAGFLVSRYRTSLSGGEKADIVLAVLLAVVAVAAAAAAVIAGFLVSRDWTSLSGGAKADIVLAVLLAVVAAADAAVIAGFLVFRHRTSLSKGAKAAIVRAVLAAAFAAAFAAAIAGFLVFRHRTSLDGGDKAGIFVAVLYAVFIVLAVVAAVAAATIAGFLVSRDWTSLTGGDKADIVLAVLLAAVAAADASAAITGFLVSRYRTSLSGGDKAAIFLAVLLAVAAATIAGFLVSRYRRRQRNDQRTSVNRGQRGTNPQGVPLRSVPDQPPHNGNEGGSNANAEEVL